MLEPLRASEFLASDGVEDWRIVSDGVVAFFRTAAYAQSAVFARAIADLDGVAAHPPAVDIREPGVTVRLISVADTWFGPSRADLELARAVSALARTHGLVAEPHRVQSLLVVPGAPDIAAVTPFWRAVLGYEPRPDSPVEDIVDPDDRLAPFWFETMDAPRADGGGSIHLAVWVPREVAEARVAAALAAGGHMVRDTMAPAWWTLADSAGNEIDVATIAERD
jgi:4a-hydroxytetrahydrobiopterin dehydratase